MKSQFPVIIHWGWAGFYCSLQRCLYSLDWRQASGDAWTAAIRGFWNDSPHCGLVIPMVTDLVQRISLGESWLMVRLA